MKPKCLLHALRCMCPTTISFLEVFTFHFAFDRLRLLKENLVQFHTYYETMHFNLLYTLKLRPKVRQLIVHAFYH